MKKFVLAITALLLSTGVFSACAGPVKLLVVGDSTASDYKEDIAPRKGWGQMLQECFDPAKVEVVNGARSSKSYYNVSN